MEDEGMSTPRRPKSSEPKLEIEYFIRTRKVLGTRIHSNGKTEETHDGHTWEPLVALSGEAMDDLRTTVAESGFFDLPARIESEQDVRDGTTLTWSIQLGSRKHTVNARKGADEANPVLARMAEAVERLVGEALNRIADAPGE